MAVQEERERPHAGSRVLAPVESARSLCVCGHLFEDHDGHGEECADCEVDGNCPAPSPPSKTCREYRPVGGVRYMYSRPVAADGC